MIDLKTLTIKEAGGHLAKGDFSAAELTQAYLDAIAKDNPDSNTYLEVFDDAMDAAHNADRVLKDNMDVHPLTGIPIAMKDNILIQGKHASAASKILESYRATYSATVIENLAHDHAIILGRTNMDEFAMGSSTENSAFGVTKNPVDSTRVPGGSSGGSAAAVASNTALAALGSETGGSIRQPASFCGVVGLKPTYGAVSRYGLIAMASSLDQIGPLTKTVDDAEILFHAIKGHDPLDSTSAPDSFYDHAMVSEKKKLVIGVPKEIFENEGVDESVRANFNATLDLLRADGHEVREVDLPNIKYSLAAYYILMPAEASTNLARMDGVRFGLHKEGGDLLGDYEKTRGEGFGREVRRRIILGAYVLSSGYYDDYYHKARAVRNVIEADFKKVFGDGEKGVDVIATPTTPTPAFKIGERVNDPVKMYAADLFTVPANIAGIPGISVPSGTVDNDGTVLPVGIQFMAPHFREDVLFHIGRDIERLVKKL